MQFFRTTKYIYIYIYIYTYISVLASGESGHSGDFAYLALRGTLNLFGSRTRV